MNLCTAFPPLVSNTIVLVVSTSLFYCQFQSQIEIIDDIVKWIDGELSKVNEP